MRSSGARVVAFAAVMHTPPSFAVRRPGFWSGALGIGLLFAFLGACSDEESAPRTEPTPPATCEPKSTTLRSLDGWSQCCEDGAEPELPRDGTLLSCAPTDAVGEPTVGEGGATGVAGAPGTELGGAGGEDGTEVPPWVVITRPFAAEWDGGGEVCLHMTSNGDAVSGDVTLFTLLGAASCQVPTAAATRPFVATESATAYLCLSRNGQALESPGPGGELVVACRVREGAPESLRVDAIDVHQETCTP